MRLISARFPTLREPLREDSFASRILSTWLTKVRSTAIQLDKSFDMLHFSLLGCAVLHPDFEDDIIFAHSGNAIANKIASLYWINYWLDIMADIAISFRLGLQIFFKVIRKSDRDCFGFIRPRFFPTVPRLIWFVRLWLAAILL